ncbi:MAG: amino acid permease C-terminal domain-containing protein [Streptomyces sp.]|uniref:amino acid permease C-terminal domain-containing protein n=1 Tax=Streptomyces sp. TaxID=1931 RepID=UPI003D6B55AC
MRLAEEKQRRRRATQGEERTPDLERPFRVPLSPALPVITALACLHLMSNLNVFTWLRFGAWLALGLLIYLFYGRRRSVLAARTQAKGEGSAPERLAG